MAAVVRVKCRPVSPVGYEVNDVGVAVTAWVAGDLLTNGAGGWSKAAAGTLLAHGIALQDAYAGQGGCSIGIQGEMDGFSGLTPGDPLYPSASVAGGLDTTAASWYGVATTPAVAVPVQPQIRAAKATRIRYLFV
jgi:hypothetical protein